MKKFRYLLLSALLIFTVKMASTQNQQFQAIDITTQLSSDQFDDIKEFVLDKRGIKLHGSRYGFVPFYEFRRLEVFLMDKDYPLNKDYTDYSLHSRALTKVLIEIAQDTLNKRILLVPRYDTEESLRSKSKELESILGKIIPMVENK